MANHVQGLVLIVYKYLSLLTLVNLPAATQNHPPQALASYRVAQHLQCLPVAFLPVYLLGRLQLG